MAVNDSGLRLMFAGTPHFAAHHLKALIDSDHQIAAVYTQPDRPAGRGKKSTPSPVKTLALHHNLAVFQPHSLKEATTHRELSEHRADVMVVVAYGLILPKAVLDIPRFGCVNVHASLLPRWRGAAPIQRAIEAGDRHTGITVMMMDTGLDTGDILCQRECVIASDETASSLHDKLLALGPPALLETLHDLQRDQLRPITQNDALATYAEKIHKEEALINWSEAADVIERKIRAFNPFPITYTYLDRERIKIHQAELTPSTSQHSPGQIIRTDDSGITVASGKGIDGKARALKITRLQLPSKKIMTIKDILNGYGERFSPGTSFSSLVED